MKNSAIYRCRWFLTLLVLIHIFNLAWCLLLSFYSVFLVLLNFCCSPLSVAFFYFFIKQKGIHILIIIYRRTFEICEIHRKRKRIYLSTHCNTFESHQKKVSCLSQNWKSNFYVHKIDFSGFRIVEQKFEVFFYMGRRVLFFLEIVVPTEFGKNMVFDSVFSILRLPGLSNNISQRKKHTPRFVLSCYKKIKYMLLRGSNLQVILALVILKFLAFFVESFSRNPEVGVHIFPSDDTVYNGVLWKINPGWFHSRDEIFNTFPTIFMMFYFSWILSEKFRMCFYHCRICWSSNYK